MGFIPIGEVINKVIYPDGSFRDRPKDGELFLDEEGAISVGYTWDDILNAWVDEKGEIYRPKHLNFPSGNESSTDSVKKITKCTCGSHSVGVNKHSDWCDLYGRE